MRAIAVKVLSLFPRVNAEMIKLLLIEDDPAMQLTLERALSRRDMQVQVCGDGALALAAWRALVPDVVVLDLTLPHLDGLQVLSAARAEGMRQPVMLLTARGTVGDRVIGLNAGADDYLPKPFDLDELVARLRALRRRHPQASMAAASPPPSPTTLSIGQLRLAPQDEVVYCGDQIMDLTPRERALLQALMERPGQAIGKERLFERVFPDELDVQFEAIEVVVYRLRKKLAGTGASLVTLRGLGYLLKPEA